MSAPRTALDAQREAFEAWATSKNLPVGRTVDSTAPYYAQSQTAAAWGAWNAAQAAMPTAPAWISVADRLPADDGDVLVWPAPAGFTHTAFLAADEEWRYGYEVDSADTDYPCEPTHWMPLPLPPAPADAKEAP